MIGEIRGPDPARTVRKSGIISLSLIAVLFFLVNVAYVAVIPREEMLNSGQLVAASFFRIVFGDAVGRSILPLLVACSCFGNMVSACFVMIGKGLAFTLAFQIAVVRIPSHRT